jgi:hypothetical protein
MHRISENLIFNTKSPQIFSPAVRCDHFGAILAVHFTIKGAQSIPSITHLISLPKLSQILSVCLSLSLSILGPAAKVEEIRSSLSPVGKSLFLPSSFSPFVSISISLSLSALLCRKKKKIRREEEEKKKKREKKKKKHIWFLIKVLF